MHKTYLSLFFLFFHFCTIPCRLLAVSPPFAGNRPWLTGPILAPSARVIPKGHVNIEPYVFWKSVYADYDDHWKAQKRKPLHQVTSQLVIKAGIFERVNISCIVQGQYKYKKHASGAGFGDSLLGLDIQLIKEEDKQLPLKLAIQEILPTGKYQHLSVKKERTDATGSGTFITVIGLTTSKLVHIQGDNYFRTRFNISYAIPSKVNAKGYNVYSEDLPGTKRALLGKTFNALCAAEYTLTENWALALDLNFFYRAKDRIKDENNHSLHTPNCHIEISAAPAIEYNFNEDVGIIIGSWFTIAGRNSEKFFSLVGALNWFF